MLHPSYLGDRPLVLWSIALGMLAVAFVVSLKGVGANEEFSAAFFRLPFIVGIFVATFVMGFMRPEMRHTWTIGMGGIPAVVVLIATQIRIFLTPDRGAEDLLSVVALALAVGLSLAFSGSSLGAGAALRLSRN